MYILPIRTEITYMQRDVSVRKPGFLYWRHLHEKKENSLLQSYPPESYVPG